MIMSVLCDFPVAWTVKIQQINSELSILSQNFLNGYENYIIFYKNYITHSKTALLNFVWLSYKLNIMKKILVVCMCLVLTLIINGQTIDKKWNVGLHGGLSQYNGDLGNSFYKFNSWHWLGGISFSRYLAKNFDINILITKGTIGYDEEGGIGNFSSNFTSVLLNARFNLLQPESFIRPYLFVGAGAMLFDKDLDITESKIDYVAPSFGAGINFKLGQSVMLNLQETFLYSTSDLRDGLAEDSNDMYLFHTVGFTFNFGKNR